LAEMRGFVFAVTFILIFGALIATIPTGLQGQGSNPDNIVPVNPSVLSGWSETETYTRANTSTNIVGRYYDYDFGSRYWRFQYDSSNEDFSLAELIYWFVFLTGIDFCRFTNANHTDRGQRLTFAEIDLDLDDEGAASYSMLLSDSGNTAGDLIIFYNTTAYANSSIAWENDELYFLHGVGFSVSATADAGALIIGLLFLQLPDVPFLVGILLAAPVYACIAYVLWFIIKEMIPFV